jgi:hypothetical protein
MMLRRDHKGFTVYAFNRVLRVNWGPGRFANGRRFFVYGPVEGDLP